MAVNEEYGPDGPDAYGPDGEMTDEPNELLPCGRDVWSVWERAENGEPDPHAETCPHCAEALSTLRHLEDVVSAARESDPGQPEADAAALVGRVMDVVRLELRPGRTLPLGERTEDAWIVEAAAARTVRAAAETLPGVRAGSCRIGPLTGEDRGLLGPPRRSREPVRVRISVAVSLTWNLQEVAEQVRDRVLAAADDELGMRVATVDVTIADLMDDTEDTDDTRYTGYTGDTDDPGTARDGAERRQP